MKLKLFTVYDSKAETYLPPFTMRATGEALRMFQETSKDKNHQFNKYASDFTLFEIGVYDSENGTIIMYEAKISLGCALEFAHKDEPL